MAAGSNFTTGTRKYIIADAPGHEQLNINTMVQEAAEKLAMNDIAQVSLKLAQPIFADRYASHRATGAFIVIDELSNNTVGAGMIL